MTSTLTRPTRPLGRVLGDLLPVVAIGVGASTVAVGLLIKAATGGLGTPLPPFLIAWAPAVQPLALVSVTVLAGAALFAPRMMFSIRRPAVFVAAVYALTLILALSLNLAHDGPRGWWSVFAGGPSGSRESAYEYLPGLHVLSRGVAYYIAHFTQLLRYLPLHAQGNPPGPLVALHWLGVTTPGALAALCIALGALTAPLAYDLGRSVGGESRGRTAALLTAFTPSLMLFGVTSADYAFAALGMCTACLLVRRSMSVLAIGCVVAALASFFSWLLLAIPAWAVLLVLLRDGRRRALICAGGCAIAITAFNVGLFAVLGYDPLAALRATGAVYAHVSSARPYAFWVFGSPVAWGVMVGVPTAWFALRAVATSDPAAVALCIVIIVSAVLGFTKAETERIWLPFAPLACVAAAAAIPPRAVGRALPLLALQALAVELLFITIW
jgi:methylthioxylose transferase